MSEMEKIDKEFEMWCEALDKALQEGVKFRCYRGTMMDKCYIVNSFDYSNMKVNVTKENEERTGMISTTIYEIEKFYKQITKNNKTSKETKKMVDKKDETAEDSTETKVDEKKVVKEPKVKSVSITKLITDFIQENPGCTFEQLEKAYTESGKLLKNGTFKKYLEEYIKSGNKQGKFNIEIVDNGYHYKEVQK
jgi:hypothetical protein